MFSNQGSKLTALFSLPLFAIFLLWPGPIIDWFLKSSLDTNIGHPEALKPLVRFGLIFTAINVFFETVRWLLNGILTATGDTLFLMISGVVCTWGFLCLPAYFFLVRPQAPVEAAFTLWIISNGLGGIIFAARFFQGKWRRQKIMG